jgi:hypothetical protein
MVTIFLPATAETGVTQERVGWPSTCTVHAPQAAIPQPNFVPVSPMTSRSAHNKGMSAGTSREWDLPLTVRAGIQTPWRRGSWRRRHKDGLWRAGVPAFTEACAKY